MNKMNRREFVKGTGGFAALATVGMPSEFALADPLGLPIGIQLYAVSDGMQKDPAGTLKKLAQIGYKEVELLAPDASAIPSLRKMLHDSGLKAPSALMEFDVNNLNKTFDQAHALGCTYCTTADPRALIAPLPSFDVPPAERDAVAKKMVSMLDAPMSGDELNKILDTMNMIGDAAAKQGLKFAAHNHIFEFNPVDGKPLIFQLMARTDPTKVKFEIDCGWAEVAGYNPVDIATMFPGRIKLLHVKDFMPFKRGVHTGDGSLAGAELGTGAIDYKPIFAGLKGKGVEHLFVEQEGPFSRMSQLQAAEVSYKYLRTFS
jgi:sugar phosphate isomerase/epimerase